MMKLIVLFVAMAFVAVQAAPCSDAQNTLGMQCMQKTGDCPVGCTLCSSTLRPDMAAMCLFSEVECTGIGGQQYKLNDCPAGFTPATTPDVNCDGTWSTCSVSCERTFTITTEKSGNGEACPISGPPCTPGTDECPTDPDACTTGKGDKDCENGGTPTGSIDAGTCSCACSDGFTGDHCETETDCTLGPDEKTCKNGVVGGQGGSCKCECGTEFTGELCEKEAPCENVVDPVDGESGECGPKLDSGETCKPTCVMFHSLKAGSEESKCTRGAFTAATCAPDVDLCTSNAHTTAFDECKAHTVQEDCTTGCNWCQNRCVYSAGECIFVETDNSAATISTTYFQTRIDQCPLSSISSAFAASPSKALLLVSVLLIARLF